MDSPLRSVPGNSLAEGELGAAGQQAADDSGLQQQRWNTSQAASTGALPAETQVGSSHSTQHLSGHTCVHFPSPQFKTDRDKGVVQRSEDDIRIFNTVRTLGQPPQRHDRGPITAGFQDVTGQGARYSH